MKDCNMGCFILLSAVHDGADLRGIFDLLLTDEVNRIVGAFYPMVGQLV